MMKKFLVIILMVSIFLTGCLASSANSVTFRDSAGRLYNVSSLYNSTTHAVSVSIVHEGKEYKCEVIYDKSFDGNLVIATDLDIFHKTGGLWIEYKNEKYSCKASAI